MTVFQFIALNECQFNCWDLAKFATSQQAK